MPDTELSASFAEHKADIVCAYVTNNLVPADNLAELIATIHKSVAELFQPKAPTVEPPTPAVNPKRSVHPDYIVCLENGKRFKSLKRHLMASYGLTPEAYREKWNLPHDYPMAAANYSAKRSEMAKKIGLGRKPVRKQRKTPG
jgi:predicted transcriptional regulator